MTFVYYILAALLVYLSFKSFRGGLGYLRHFRDELSRPPHDHRPFATIIAPCRGVDPGLAANLEAVLSQKYPEFEVIFAIDDAGDPSAAIIAGLIKDRPNAKLVIASKAEISSQKVENLRESVLHANPRSEVFVFVDSDVRPGEQWLASLTAALADEDTGAATGYRWYFAKEPGLAAELRSSWNASIASALGPNTGSNFCWGGSMAIRRDVFESLDIREQWLGTLSDDFAVTRAMNAAGKPIRFVPRALSATVENCSLRGLFEFTTRQMKITRVYARNLWLLSFFGSGLFILVMAWSVVKALSSPVLGLEWAAAWITLLAVAGLSTGKSVLRTRAVRLALPEYAAAIDRQNVYQHILWLFTPLIFFANCAAALLSRRIKWRGTVYEMRSPHETRLLKRP